MMWAPNPPHPAYNGPDEWIDSQKPFYGKMSFDETYVRKNVRPDESGKWAIGKTRDRGKTLDAAHEYFAMVSEVDQQIGRLLDYLKTTDDPRNPGYKLAENTIVVLTSDHGEMLNSQALGGKTHVFSESVDVPLLIRWPAKLKPRIEESFFNIVDHLPTVASLAGLSSLIPKTVRGRNLSALLTSSHADLRQQAALFISGSKRGLITKKYSLVASRSKGGDMLDISIYDNINDAYQAQSLDMDDLPDSDSKKLIRDFIAELERADDPWEDKHLLTDLIK
jgi:arylsulfatase A-like enzyme